MTAPDVFRSFRSDHRRVLARLDSVERAMKGRGRARRIGPAAEAALAELVEHLGRQFATHMRTEEDVLYPALSESLPEAAAGLAPLRSDHRELRGMRERLAALLAKPAGPGRDEQVAVQVRDFTDLLRIHIHKEEATVFRVAARILTPDGTRELQARVAANRSRGAGGMDRTKGKG